MTEGNNHGNTPAAWTGSIIIMIAFFIGTLSVVLGNWMLFWIGGVGLAVVGAIVGRVMAGMGMGQQPRSS